MDIRRHANQFKFRERRRMTTLINKLYSELGGEVKLKQLVDIFYDVMDRSPESRNIRDLHPRSLKISREKLFMFLSGVFGGPNLYQEKYGHPRLRARHLPFKIGSKEKEQWLWCMNIALLEMAFAPDISKKLSEYFETTADHMINQEKPHDPFNIRG